MSRSGIRGLIDSPASTGRSSSPELNYLHYRGGKGCLAVRRVAYRMKCGVERRGKVDSRVSPPLSIEYWRERRRASTIVFDGGAQQLQNTSMEFSALLHEQMPKSPRRPFVRGRRLSADDYWGLFIELWKTKSVVSVE